MKLLKRNDALHLLKKYITADEIDLAGQKWLELENGNEAYVPVHYAYYNILYQKRYFEDVWQNYTDISVVLWGGGRPIGMWPVAYWFKDGKYVIGSNGMDLLPPLFVFPMLTTEAKRKIIEKCIVFLEALAGELNVSDCCVRETVMKAGDSEWIKKVLERGAVCHGVSTECYVDLHMDLDAILGAMRRTNRYSIKKAGTLWVSEIVNRDSADDKIKGSFESFRSLHIDVAGRETRALQTWQIQEEALRKSDDYLIMLYDHDNNLIGGSLYSTTGTAVTYSVAAYKRELFNQPVGHISQWLAIKYAKQIGKSWYYIGKRPYSGDLEKPTDKELTIGHFKEGFATNFYNTIYMNLKLGGA